jgi:hypothetical protein
MLLVGNNTLNLNGATVCAIVAKHLNESMSYSYKERQEIQVSEVSHKEGIYSFKVTLTEKPPKP